MSKYVEDEQFEQAMLDIEENEKPIHQITIGDVLILYFNWVYLKITQLHNYTTSFRCRCSDLISSYMRKMYLQSV